MDAHQFLRAAIATGIRDYNAARAAAGRPEEDIPVVQGRPDQAVDAYGVQVPGVVWQHLGIHGLDRTLEGTTDPSAKSFEILTRARADATQSPPAADADERTGPAKAEQMAQAIVASLQSGTRNVGVTADYDTPSSRDQAEANYFEHTLEVIIAATD